MRFPPAKSFPRWERLRREVVPSRSESFRERVPEVVPKIFQILGNRRNDFGNDSVVEGPIFGNDLGTTQRERLELGAHAS